MANRLSYQLIEFFRRYQAAGRPLALVAVLRTEGSTYSKAGNLMLVDADDNWCGMLSGGCLEGEIAERARNVIAGNTAEIVTYDLAADDEIFGLGVGCDGTLHVVLQPLTRENRYEPFSGLVETLEATGFGRIQLPDGDEIIETEQIVAPLRVLLLGAGQDADPLVRFGVALGWEVAISDHRPAAVDRIRASGATTVQCRPAADLADGFDLDRFDAAVVMSHNLSADRAYLGALASSSIEFIGLLGPPHRKNRLLGELGDKAAMLGDRVHGPVGKAIGGRGAAAIALEIAAELQSRFNPEN